MNKKAKAISRYKKQSIAQKRLEPLNEEELQIVFKKYYFHARSNGFITNFDEAVAKNAKFFTPHQRKIAETIIRSIFQKKGWNIYVSITRQFGKTDIVADIMDFCFKEFYNIFKTPMGCGIVAPEKKTASRVFDRVNNLLVNSGHRYEVNKSDYKKTIRGDRICLFGIFEGNKGSTHEGETLDLIVRDEAHKGDDEMFADQIKPAVLRTAGTVVWIGNGSIGDCAFSKGLDEGNTERSIVLRYTYYTLKDYMTDLANKGLITAKYWVDGIEAYIKEHGGEESFFVKKNIYCQTIRDNTQFMSIEQVMRCGVDMDEIIKNYKRNGGLPRLYMSVDFGHSHDRTIVTFLNENREIEDWLQVRNEGETVPLRTQCERIRDYCDGKGYTQRLIAIGGDATGLGIGAIEFLEIEFGCDIIRYTFSAPRKHDWFLSLRDVMTSSEPLDRIKFNKNHPLAAQFVKECSELRISRMKSGFLSFHAPDKIDAFDDMMDSLVMANNIFMGEHGVYANLKPKSTRKLGGLKIPEIETEESHGLYDLYTPKFAMR